MSGLPVSSEQAERREQRAFVAYSAALQDGSVAHWLAEQCTRAGADEAQLPAAAASAAARLHAFKSENRQTETGPNAYAGCTDTQAGHTDLEDEEWRGRMATCVSAGTDSCAAMRLSVQAQVAAPEGMTRVCTVEIGSAEFNSRKAIFEVI